MEWTSLNDLREQFLSFFESKQHTRLPSFPLVPIGDNSLLLINSDEKILPGSGDPAEQTGHHLSEVHPHPGH